MLRADRQAGTAVSSRLRSRMSAPMLSAIRADDALIGPRVLNQSCAIDDCPVIAAVRGSIRAAARIPPAATAMTTKRAPKPQFA